MILKDDGSINLVYTETIIINKMKFMINLIICLFGK